MGVVVHPFCAWRPKAELVEKVASPPYDVLNSAEARVMAEGNPLSFLHVNKPEIDLPVETPSDDDAVYAKGRENLDKLLGEACIQDSEPRLYVYQQRMGDHVQAGIVAGASAFDYEADRIKKHELTRENKERDRIHHVETLGAHTGPVFLTYHAHAEIDAIVDAVRAATPDYDFVSDDGIGHTLWVIRDQDLSQKLITLFASLDALYVADGHHRSAAGTAVSKAWRQRDPALPKDHEVHFFLAVIFPDNQMQILDYNRVVKDLNGLSSEAFLAKVRKHFDVSPTTEKKPSQAQRYGMFLDGQWYQLQAKAGSFDANDPVQALDISILQNNLLAPILGIKDPRTDERIDFVGGIRGVNELERRCQVDMKVAFALYPTSMAQLMRIADAGLMMPPKSTWFEPKLRSGLIIHTFDR